MRCDRCQHFSKALRIANLILHVIVSLKHGIMAAGVGFPHCLTVFEMLFYAVKLEIEIEISLSGTPSRHPSATSSTIITLKPTAKNTVPTLECCPCDISGISSSTTTYSMAPAAKLSR